MNEQNNEKKERKISSSRKIQGHRVMDGRYSTEVKEEQQ